MSAINPKVLHEVYASKIIRAYLRTKMDRLEELRERAAVVGKSARGVGTTCIAIQTESKIIKQQLDVVLSLARNEERLLIARKALEARTSGKPLVAIFAAAEVIGDIYDEDKEFVGVVPMLEFKSNGSGSNGNGHAPTNGKPALEKNGQHGKGKK
ncbi:MAG: hypothetical protein ABIG63_11265 [Chloroflexota bacterium]